MPWYALLSVAAVFGSAFVTLTMVMLALSKQGKARAALFLVALLWLALCVRGLMQLVQSGS